MHFDSRFCCSVQIKDEKVLTASKHRKVKFRRFLVFCWYFCSIYRKYFVFWNWSGTSSRRHCESDPKTVNTAFSLTRLAFTQIYWNKWKHLHQKRLHSHRIGLVHQRGRRFILSEHQYDRCVMWKRSIAYDIRSYGIQSKQIMIINQKHGVICFCNKFNNFINPRYFIRT